MSLAGTPIIILKEGTQRTRGRDALRNNIRAGIIISDAIRSALGPLGRDKMLVDSFGDVVITNDGATILKEMDVTHPIAKFIVELAKSQDQEVGDGTTTVAVLAGEFLKKAEELLDSGIHPSVIVEGYRMATKKALEVIEEIGTDVKEDDRSILRKIAITSMGSKVISTYSDYLADLVVDAVLAVKTEKGVDIDNIKVEKKAGEDLSNTHLIKGIVLDKEVVHPSMPKKVENAKIALVDSGFEVSKTEFNAELNITDPSQLQQFIERETEIIAEKVQKIVDVGANVVFCQKGIEDIAQHLLAKKGIMAVRRVKKSDMEKLAKATGAHIVTELKDMTEDDLGSAGKVHQTKIGDDDMLFIEDTPYSKSVTILIRGGTELVVDEAERAIHDALCVVRNVVNTGKIVVGGGSPEMAVSAKLLKYADSFKGKEQLAVRAFAEALEAIPRILAENSGMEPLDVLVELRSAHQQGKHTFGVNPLERKVMDMKDSGVIEPIVVKKQAISSASEAAQMILRIDDVIASKETGGAGGPPGGPGAGGEDGGEFD